MKNKILLTGATGFQGLSILKQLTLMNQNIRLMVPKGEDTIPVEHFGAEISRGSFDDIQSLEKAFGEIDKAVISFPLIFDRDRLLTFAKNVVAAWKKSTLSLVVFNTNLPVLDREVGLTAFDIKREIEQYFDREKLPYISLRPTLYMDNLSAPFLLPIVKEKNILPYPVPADKKIAWISHEDMAKFVVAALQRPELTGNKYNIGGLQLISGIEMAAVISKHAQKQISFISVNPDDFENQLAGSFGRDTAKEIANIYRFVSEDSDSHLKANNLREKTLIDFPVSLSSFDSWAKSVNWN